MDTQLKQEFTEYVLAKFKKFRKNPLVLNIVSNIKRYLSFYFYLRGSNHLDIVQDGDKWLVQLDWHTGHRVTVGEIIDEYKHKMNSKLSEYPKDIVDFVESVVKTFKETLKSNASHYMEELYEKYSLKKVIKKKIACNRMKLIIADTLETKQGDDNLLVILRIDTDKKGNYWDVEVYKDSKKIKKYNFRDKDKAKNKFNKIYKEF